MKLDMSISQATLQELPKASSLILNKVHDLQYYLPRIIGANNYETIEKLQFSSFSNALDIHANFAP